MRVLQRFGRLLLLLTVRLVFRSRRGEAIDSTAIRRVLVIRTDTRVGNVLLTTPLVRALRRGLPGARVDFLVAAGKQQLVADLADRLVVFDKQAFFKAPLRFWRFLSALRRERYDLVVEAGHWHAFSFTSLALAWFTGAPARVGHLRGESARFLTHAVVKDPAVEREVASKLELLRPIGIADAGEQLETTVDASPEAAAAAEAILQAARGARVAALNPGARKADHRWPATAFGRLARELHERHGIVPMVTWGPGEEPLARAVLEASRGAAVLAPPTNLATLAAVFRRSAVVVTNDTGPMHLAAATGAPVVAVLMAEDGARWSHAGRFCGVPVRTGCDEELERVVTACAAFLDAAAPASAG